MELRARKGASDNELRADLLRLTFVTTKEAPILTLGQRSARVPCLWVSCLLSHHQAKVLK